MSNPKSYLPQSLYMVYDTYDARYWCNVKGKMVWDKPRFAKSAWNTMYRLPFNSQNRYVIHEFMSTGWERTS